MKDEKLTTTSMLCDLQSNLQILRQIFIDDETVTFREFDCLENRQLKFCAIYIDFMVNKQVINEHILKPIMNCKLEYTSNILDELQKSILSNGELSRSSDFKTLAESIIDGNTVLVVDNCSEAVIINTVDFKTRGIEEPTSETVVSGPREGFNESIHVNMSLIRRKIKTPDLKFKFKVLGERTKTKVCICYIEGIAQPAILDELNRRLGTINIDGILDAEYIVELIKDEPLSPFRTIGSTERPDIVASKLLEGRIALLCDGSPTVLTLPFIFIEIFQANDDYYGNYIYSSINRLLRWSAFVLTTSVPAIYISLVNFHQEMIPTTLLLSILTARQGVPFPTIVEAFSMIFAFELLREAGIRIPKPIGQAVSIAGALILGQSAVQARLVSAPMVIIAALTGISSVLLPRVVSVIVIRVIFLFFACILGFYGFIFSAMGLGIYLMSMRSFGVPYMLNCGTGPIKFEDIKDTMIRAPWWLMKDRPRGASLNRKRMKDGRQNSRK